MGVVSGRYVIKTSGAQHDREDTVVKLYGHVTPRGRALAVGSVGSWWEHDGSSGGAEPQSQVAQLRATVAELEKEIARLRADDPGAFGRQEQVGSKLAESAGPGRPR